MSFAQEHIELFSTTPLQSLFPGGMFDELGGQGEENASRAFSIIESLILESTARNALRSRYALLQSFPRIAADPDVATESLHDDETNFSDHCRRYAASLMPLQYKAFLESLDETETELFLKIYLLGHEIWGMEDGIASVVRLFAEHAIGFAVPVRVERLAGEDRKFPDHLQSRLGSTEQYSFLGKDFVLGRRLNSRPEHHHIRIGPISLRSLEKLQQRGWALDMRPGPKLEQLVECISPFYFSARIHIAIETVGCVLGRVTLGKDRLGVVASDGDASVEASLGVA